MFGQNTVNFNGGYHVQPNVECLAGKILADTLSHQFRSITTQALPAGGIVAPRKPTITTYFVPAQK